MTKRIIVILLVVSIGVFAAAQTLQAQEESIGVGVQYQYPSFGLSGMFDVTEDVTVQGTVGFIGTVQTYGVRGLYHFTSDTFWRAYGYGEVGLINWQVAGDTETSFGGGIGAGVEYGLQAFNEELPPVYYNANVGVVTNDYFDGFSMNFGTGVMFKF